MTGPAFSLNITETNGPVHTNLLFGYSSIMGEKIRKIKSGSLVPLDLFSGEWPLRIDLAYCKPEPENIFGKIYRKEARLWLAWPLACTVLGAAKLCEQRHVCRFVLYDGLRTMNAQKRMEASPIVQKNSHWLKDGLLSSPGSGGHPRGMAIDLSLETASGEPIDMGTAFDYLAINPDAQNNPAHRDYIKMRDAVRTNRKMLSDAMMDAAKLFKTELLPLPQEWWDFRLPPEVYNEFMPLKDEDLPPQMRMTDDVPENQGPDDLPPEHFAFLKEKIEGEVGQALALI